MPFHPCIAIIGGGPAGLALSLLLRQHGLRPTIFELRPKPTPADLARPCGMLDLHAESGQRVLGECGLQSAFEATLGDCSEACRVLDPRGNVMHTDDGGLASRPEIARNALTGLLLDALPEDAVRWEQKVLGVVQDPASKEITLNLASPTSDTEKYDFVVGADGAWSRVRALLNDVKPSYTGAHFLTATARHASTRFPHLVSLVGSGSFHALGHGHGLMTHRGPQDSIRLYASVASEEAWMRDKSVLEVKDAVLGPGGAFADWAPELKELVATCCDEEARDHLHGKADLLGMYILPVGHRWEHCDGVTLVGDAAHLMTPWGGEGVNLALWDVLDLAEAIGGVGEVKDGEEWRVRVAPRVRKFEEGMWERAQEKAAETEENRRNFLAEDGGRRMAKMFAQAFGAMEGGG